MRFASKTTTLCLALVVVVGCQASATGTGVGVEPHASPPAKEPAPPPGLSEADAEAICTMIRTAECDRLERCSPKRLQVEFGDKAACIAHEKSVCKSVFVLPGTAITNAQAKTCATKYAAAACDATDPVAECILPGAIHDGGACMSENQCASGFCKGGSMSTCGTCQPAQKPKPTVLGAACKADEGCGVWARCEGGKCVSAGKAKGGKCNQHDSCNWLQNLGCNAGTCFEASAVAEPGGSCKPDEAAKALRFCNHGACDVQKNICVANKREGETCDGTAPCEPWLHCVKATKKCAAPKFEWSSCSG